MAGVDIRKQDRGLFPSLRGSVCLFLDKCPPFVTKKERKRDTHGEENATRRHGHSEDGHGKMEAEAGVELPEANAAWAAACEAMRGPGLQTQISGAGFQNRDNKVL